jgi:hypothetical protein
MTERRLPPPRTVKRISGGLKVVDANGQSLAHVYSRESPADARTAGVLTEDEARRIGSNIAKPQALLGITYLGANPGRLIFAVLFCFCQQPLIVTQLPPSFYGRISHDAQQEHNPSHSICHGNPPVFRQRTCPVH